MTRAPDRHIGWEMFTRTIRDDNHPKYIIVIISYDNSRYIDDYFVFSIIINFT